MEAKGFGEIERQNYRFNFKICEDFAVLGQLGHLSKPKCIARKFESCLE